MLRPLVFFFLINVVLLLAGHSNAAPIFIPRSQDLGSRADAALDQPVTVTVVHHTDTSLGTVTETCKITLVSKGQRDGRQVVEEIKKCKVSLDAGVAQGGGDTGSSNTNSSNTNASSTTASASPPPTTSSSQGVPSSAPASSSNPTAGDTSSSSPPSSPASSSSSTSSSSASASSNPALSVNGVSTVNSAATPTGSSTAASSTSSPPAPAITSSSPSTSSSGPQADSSSSASASGSGSAAASEQTSTAAFAVPGKKLSVLPIGLGVFAGISVIALIVVGLVTYERTKYRKAFRQRKLAEAGANMGYGGMAERP